MSLAVLDHVSIGRPITRAGVSLFPVYLRQPNALTILTGAGAPIVISEQPAAHVPTLLATSTADVPVLLVEGEIVVGGHQHRTLDVSVLVAPHTTIELPVSCVEQGRWGGGSEFVRSRTFAPRRVRRVKHARAVDHVPSGDRRVDQGLIWESVSAELHRHDAVNVTSAVVGTDDLFQRDERLDAAERDLVGRGPLPGQNGVVISHGRRVVCAEVFGDPRMFTVHWEAIVRAALLDAPDARRGKPSATQALRFLHRVVTATPVENDGVGIGREQHVRTHRLVAQGLDLDDHLVHGAAFALAS